MPPRKIDALRSYQHHTENRSRLFQAMKLVSYINGTGGVIISGLDLIDAPFNPSVSYLDGLGGLGVSALCIGAGYLCGRREKSIHRKADGLQAQIDQQVNL